MKHLTPLNQKMLKEAMEKYATATASPGFMQLVGMPLGILAATSGLAGLYGYYSSKGRMQAHHEALEDSKRNLASYHHDYHKDPNLSNQRFNELALISPTLATNVGLAHKVIHPRLKSGFSLEDIERLATIENKASQSPSPYNRVMSPISTGTAAATGAMATMLPMLAPAIGAGVHEYTMGGPIKARDEMIAKVRAEGAKAHRLGQEGLLDSKENAQAALMVTMQKSQMPPEVQRGFVAEWAKTYGHMSKKEASAMDDIFAEQIVGDECLGRMLSDRHFMLKEAGVMKPITDFFASNAKLPKSSGSAGATFNYLKAMSVPLAIGLGFSAVNKLMQMRENHQMGQEADRVFASLKRSSDIIKENPDAAAEAFDALRSFAPVLATKPLIARTFIEDTVNKRSMAPQTADMLAGAQQKIMDIQSITGHGGGFMAGLKEPMSLFQFKAPGADDGKQRRSSGKKK